MRELGEEQFWQIEDRQEAARRAYQVGAELRQSQRDTIRRRCADFLALYDPSAKDALPGSTIGIFGREHMLPSFNVIQAAVDSLESQITKDKIRPWAVTSKGDGELKERAEGISRFTEAQFQEGGIYGPLGTVWFKDGCIYGDGLVKVTPDYANKRVTYTRCRTWDVHFDVEDARDGNPRTMFHVCAVDRSVLLAMYADDSATRAIEEAAAVEADEYDSRQDGKVSDKILVCEAWHLPSGRVDLEDEESFELNDRHDGRRVLSIDGEDGCLEYEAWPYDYHPIEFFSPLRRNEGKRGRGVVETLFGVQCAINKLSRRIDDILRLHGRPIVAIPKGSRTSKQQISNALDTVIDTVGNGGIQYIVPQPVPAQVFEERDRLIRYGFQQLGVSEMSATGDRPKSLQSGEAINTLVDATSVRQSKPYSEWENAHIGLALKSIDAARLIAQRSSSDDEVQLTVMWGDSDDLKRINWRDVDMKRDQYHLRVWPANLFGSTPTSRLNNIMNFIREGVLPKEMLGPAVGNPDLESMLGDHSAAIDNIERLIDDAIGGQSPEPSAYMNLPLALKMVTDKLNRLEADRVTGSKPEALRELAERINGELKRLQPPQPAAPPGPPGPEGGPPGMPAPAPAVPQVAA